LLASRTYFIGCLCLWVCLVVDELPFGTTLG
jgi:hypothetical protein